MRCGIDCAALPTFGGVDQPETCLISSTTVTDGLAAALKCIETDGTFFSALDHDVAAREWVWMLGTVSRSLSTAIVLERAAEGLRPTFATETDLIRRAALLATRRRALLACLLVMVLAMTGTGAADPEQTPDARDRRQGAAPRRRHAKEPHRPVEAIPVHRSAPRSRLPEHGYVVLEVSFFDRGAGNQSPVKR